MRNGGKCFKSVLLLKQFLSLMAFLIALIYCECQNIADDSGLLQTGKLVHARLPALVGKFFERNFLHIRSFIFIC